LVASSGEVKSKVRVKRRNFADIKILGKVLFDVALSKAVTEVETVGSGNTHACKETIVLICYKGTLLSIDFRILIYQYRVCNLWKIDISLICWVVLSFYIYIFSVTNLFLKPNTEIKFRLTSILFGHSHVTECTPVSPSLGTKSFLYWVKYFSFILKE